jgi:hypothetical protein
VHGAGPTGKWSRLRFDGWTDMVLAALSLVRKVLGGRGEALTNEDLSNAIQYNKIQHNAIQYNTIQ